MDGLALRELPSRTSRMFTALHEGDYLIVGTERCFKGVCDTDKREWTHVTVVPRIYGLSPRHEPKNVTFGWVRSKYIQGFECPEDQPSEAQKEQEPSISAPRVPTYNHPSTPDPSKGRTRLTVYGPKAISEQDPPKPTPTEPPKTANANPICPPSALMRQIGWVEEGRISGSS